MGLFLGFDKVAILMVGHVLSALLIFPGATAVNFAGERFFPRRTWAVDPRRPRLAGWLSVPLIWSLVLFSAILDVGPGAFLKDRLGWFEAWIVHVAGLTIVGSTLSLVIGWALPPRKARP